ncbi:hypothetical protein [Persicobacter diffluens]|uniref:Uncharacterized protein n=1 Tax=Persicobacter diffluens TaxID=981 RepID=A0AAN4W4N1_9BACT|nr:hypothetical protein PEDI_51580 [Persicobacter diffluens]
MGTAKKYTYSQFKQWARLPNIDENTGLLLYKERQYVTESNPEQVFFIPNCTTHFTRPMSASNKKICWPWCETILSRPLRKSELIHNRESYRMGYQSSLNFEVFIEEEIVIALLNDCPTDDLYFKKLEKLRLKYLSDIDATKEIQLKQDREFDFLRAYGTKVCKVLAAKRAEWNNTSLDAELSKILNTNQTSLNLATDENSGFSNSYKHYKNILL